MASHDLTAMYVPSQHSYAFPAEAMGQPAGGSSGEAGGGLGTWFADAADQLTVRTAYISMRAPAVVERGSGVQEVTAYVPASSVTGSHMTVPAD